MIKHGSVIRLTMFLASLDLKTAFDEARLRHVAQIMEDHNTHGWIIAGVLREMAGLQGQALFECVESTFSIKRCVKQGSVEAPRLWQKMAMTAPGKGGRGLGEETKGRPFRFGRTKNPPDVQSHVGRQFLGHIPFQDST